MFDLWYKKKEYRRHSKAAWQHIQDVSIPAIMSDAMSGMITSTFIPVSWGAAEYERFEILYEAPLPFGLTFKHKKEPFVTVCQCTPYMRFPASTISSVRIRKMKTRTSLQLCCSRIELHKNLGYVIIELHVLILCFDTDSMCWPRIRTPGLFKKYPVLVITENRTGRYKHNLRAMLRLLVVTTV